MLRRSTFKRRYTIRILLSKVDKINAVEMATVLWKGLTLQHTLTFGRY